MDVAGTVVGVISLGISLCDGITTYCHAWKHQDDDVRSLTALCESLKQLLQNIEQGVKRSQNFDPSIVEKLNDTLRACTDHSEAVLRLTERYTVGPPTTAWKGKARELAQMLKFPFEKKTLEELKNTMIAFRGNVDTAMGLINLLYFMFWDSNPHEVELTTKSDISISTQDAIQTLREENSKNHLTILGEIQPMSELISQLIGKELNQKLPQLEDSLSQKINNSRKLIESTVSNSYTAISQSVMAEKDLRLPELKDSAVSSIAKYIDNSRSSIEATVANSSAEIRSAFDTHTRQQMMALTSILNEIPEDQRQYYPKIESLKLPIFGPSLPRSKKRRRKKNLDPAKQISPGCKCCPNIGHINSSPFYSWGLGKESEVFLIHKRSCPLWYHSQIITKYSVNVLLLQRLRIFGSLSINRSPYNSIFRWSISQSLTYRAVVPDDAPAFKVLQRYLVTPKFSRCENCIRSCSLDLKTVFQSGQGSPHDTLANGTTLIELTRELLELGVEMNLDRNPSKLSYDSKSPWTKFHEQIFSGYTTSFPEGRVSQFNTRAQNALDFLFWLTKHDIEIPASSLKWARGGYRSETKPWHGFKIILKALRSYEDFGIATECGVLSTAVLRQDKLAVQKILEKNPQFLETERNVFGQSPIHLAIGWPDGLEFLLRAADESLLHRDLEYKCGNGSTPLDYAIAFGCPGSIRLLADADVAFDFNWRCFVGTDVLDPDVNQVILDIILERLRQLLEFGKQKLPAEKLSSLQITSFESFDLKVTALLNCLHTENIQLPGKFAGVHNRSGNFDNSLWDFWPQFGGIFHQHEICPSTAVTFFQAGVTCVDSEVEQITPLINISAPKYYSQYQFCFSRYFGIVEFFVEKGGRLDRHIPSNYIIGPLLSNKTVNSHRVIHRIASSSGTGAIFFESTEAVAVAQLWSSQIWQNILQSNTSDPCICACASGGCRPISLALKSLVDSAWMPYYQGFNYPNGLPLNWGMMLNPQHWEIAVNLLFTLKLFLDCLEGEQLADDVIRLLTFSALGLSHTCCRHLSASVVYFSGSCSHHKMIKVMDPTDVEEIRDEEAELIETLDCLVDKFTKDFRELGIPLSKFLLETWQETMFAELSIRDEIPKPLREQLEELGVTISVSSSSDSEEEDNEMLNKQSSHSSDSFERKKKEDNDYTEWIDNIRTSIKTQ